MFYKDEMLNRIRKAQENHWNESLLLEIESREVIWLHWLVWEPPDKARDEFTDIKQHIRIWCNQILESWGFALEEREFLEQCSSRAENILMRRREAVALGQKGELLDEMGLHINALKRSLIKIAYLRRGPFCETCGWPFPDLSANMPERLLKRGRTRSRRPGRPKNNKSG